MPNISPNKPGSSQNENTLFNADSNVFSNVTELSKKDESVSLEKTSVHGSSYDFYQEETGIFNRFIASFKRAPDTTSDSGSAQFEKDISAESDKKLKKNIKPRHVLMMSLGSGVGTGMLVGNGKALHNGGPASLVIGYSIMGTCLYAIIQAAGEMAVSYSSLVGNFNAYPSLLIDPALGFSVAWVYCLQWLCVLPLELVTASITIKYWTTSINPDAFVAIFYTLIVAINFCGSKGYAEADFFFNSCKVLMITGFFILGIIINCGGAGDSGYIGGKYWHNPGAFSGDRAIDHFKGVVSTLVTSAFAFGGTEFVALTSAEQANPRRAIPSAAKQVLYRIVFLFLGSITLIGFLVPYTSDELMGSGDAATHASPYVIAIASHGVKVVPHFINAVILIAVLSVGNSALFSSSRLLLSLSQQGYAPAILQYIDREGRPLMAMLVSCVFGMISFVAASPREETVFTWLLAISGLSQLFTWSAICLSHIRLRRAMTVQGRSLGELGYKSQTGVWGSIYAVFVMFLILCGQFWVAIAPVGSDKLDVSNFFANYLAMPILIVLYFGFKIWKKDWRLYIPADKIDLHAHRKIFDEDILRQEDNEYQEKIKSSGWIKKSMNFWC
ncbi:LAFE_0G01530g1_1 [Lachancea fermentati]|uniref:LAFE_0G01530g1_1 n=1 Tax=Lachancea fermentati TaxID=4955 RepID=A0A1G4MGP2_LACFM|nr:LAFE_0G01530g1_1 [Lachancea fermentati]